VVARVHHDALCAHAGAGHHRSVTCEAAAALGLGVVGGGGWRGFLIYSGFVRLGPSRSGRV
jgi:hypothetical protein